MIKEFYDHHKGGVYVAFSGGKDSTVLLDLCRRLYPEITAVFCDTGLEYPENRAFAETIDNVTVVKPKVPFTEVLNLHGYPVISKEVAKIIKYARRGTLWAANALEGKYADGAPCELKKRYKKWKFLLNAPFEISDHCCYVMKKSPLEIFQRREKKYPIIGITAADSLQRKQGWFKTGCNSFAQKSRSKPLSFWTEQDILLYLKEYNSLGYSEAYGELKIKENLNIKDDKKEETTLYFTGAERTGCMFCMFGAHLEKEPNRFQKMKLSHPKLYDYCINKLGCGEVLDYLQVKY